MARLIYNLERLRGSRTKYSPELVQEMIEVVQDINDARCLDSQALTSHLGSSFVRFPFCSH